MSDEIERRNAEPKAKPGGSFPRKAATTGGRGKKVGHGLVVASAAAVLAVYAAGYTTTQSAAAQIVAQAGSTAAYATPAASATATSAPSTMATRVARAITTSAAVTSAASVPDSPTSIPGMPTSIPSTPTNIPATPTSAPRPTATSVPAAPSAKVASTTTSASTAATSAASAAAKASAYQDGTYSGMGTSRHGSVWATVVIKNGRIVSAQITNSTTRYPIARIALLPGEVVAQQSANVNYVSGATDSSMAYLDAVAGALAQAA